MTNLSEQSLEEAIIQMRDSIVVEPKRLWVYPKYINIMLRALGLITIKQPIKRSASMRKKKRNLYWREKK